MPLLEHLRRNREAIISRLTVGRWFTDRKPNVEADRVINSTLFKESQIPLAMMLDLLRGEVAFIKHDDRISFVEAVTFIGRSVRLFYAVVIAMPSDPAEQKAVVMLAVDEFYTKEIAPLDIPYIPSWIENRFVDPMVGGWFHDAASALYDIIVDAIETTVLTGHPVGQAMTLAVNPGIAGEQSTVGGIAMPVNPTIAQQINQAVFPNAAMPEAMGVNRDVGNADGGRYADEDAGDAASRLDQTDDGKRV